MRASYSTNAAGRVRSQQGVAAHIWRRRVLPICAALKTESRTDKLRTLLKQPGILQGPCCHDGLSARLIERAGFPFAFMSGFCTAGARLGAPDTGLISYAEMLDTGRNVNEATRHIPIIGDGDTGYGNAMNVKRTVRGYAQAGFAGILIEDQVAPKSCGHVKGKRVVSREEAVARIRAAVDARDEGADILIVARTDARQAVSMEEALWRIEAFAEAGADILFIDALESEEEMRRFCWASGAASRVPKMASMLEGGKTPILSPKELQMMGFKLVAYPLSLLGVSIKAMDDALTSLKQGVIPGPSDLGSFQDIQAAVGFPEYYAEQERYAVSTAEASHTHNTTAATTTTASAPPPPPPSPPQATPARDTTTTKNGSQNGHSTAGVTADTKTDSATDTKSSTSMGSAGSTSKRMREDIRPDPKPSSGGRPPAESEKMAGGVAGAAAATAAPVVEADAIEEPGSQLVLSSASRSDTDSESESESREKRHGRYFLIKITEKNTGVVKLQTRIPTNFLAGLTAVVPAVAGINLESILDKAMRERTKETGGPLVSQDIGGGDLLEVFLEYQ